MRLCELRDMKVRTLDGESLGRVHDVYCDEAKVVALMCGFGSFIERWTGRGGGRRIPWEWVKRVERDAIVVAPSASRSLRGTRRPTAPRSKR